MGTRMRKAAGARMKGKVFSIKPRRPRIRDMASPVPYRVITRDRQICVLYSGVWREHWGKAILDSIRRHGCGLEWQCYLGSFVDCSMTKQRKPACSSCEFRDECREVAGMAGRRGRGG